MLVLGVIFWINLLAFGSTLKSPPRRTKSASDLFTNFTSSLICRWRYLITFNVHSKMALCPPVVVVLSTGVSYEDIDGNIGMWLHADSSHTLKWFILFVGKQEIFLRSKYLWWLFQIYLSSQVLPIVPKCITMIGVREKLDLWKKSDGLFLFFSPVWICAWRQLRAQSSHQVLSHHHSWSTGGTREESNIWIIQQKSVYKFSNFFD